MTDEAKELASWLHAVTTYWPHLPDWTLYESSQISAAWRTHGEHVPLLAIYASDKRRKRDGAQAFIVLEASQTDLIIDVGVNVDVSERDPMDVVDDVHSADIPFDDIWIGFLEDQYDVPLSRDYSPALSDRGFVKLIRKALDTLDNTPIVLRLRAVGRTI